MNLSEIKEYLKQHENKELCRFITCGSVDDGKSTLIGRMLYDSKSLFEDQIKTLKKDSQKNKNLGGGAIRLCTFGRWISK